MDKTLNQIKSELNEIATEHLQINEFFFGDFIDAISRDAVDYLINVLQDKAVAITKRAYTIAKHSKRKKITKGDIDLAIKGF